MKDEEKRPLLDIIERSREPLDDGFMKLLPRKNKDTGEELTEQQKQLMSDAWFGFHIKANHPDIFSLCDKLNYCQNYTYEQETGDHFLSLICDRTFLFLNCRDRESTSPKLPLIEAVLNGNSYKNWGYVTDQELDAICQHPFVPDASAQNAYLDWQRRLKELQAAKALRIEHLKSKPVFVYGKGAQGGFYCFIPKGQPNKEELCKAEKQLCLLFDRYITACHDLAYENWSYLEEQPKQKWKSGVHQVYQNLPPKEAYAGQYALIVFNLFVKNAQRLLHGALQKYYFSEMEKRKNYRCKPNDATRQIRGRIQCNIQLFDLLLEILYPEASESELRDAKFSFYCYTRYDMYWHYKIDPEADWIHFNHKEDYTDGVDYFGNLLRYNINYCIPSGAQWLRPIMTLRGAENPLYTLTTFLLSDAMRPSKPMESLTSSILRYHEEYKASLNPEKSGKGKRTAWGKLLEIYRANYMDSDKIGQELNKWVKENRLISPDEEDLQYEGKLPNTVRRYGSSYIVEYVLKMDLIEEARENLGRAAEQYFDKLCLDGFCFIPHDPIRPLKKRK